MYEVVRTATVRILERLGYLTVNSKVVSEQLERNFHAQTTAANLAGMGRVMSFKNSMMLTAPRIFGLITLLAPDAVQTAWEAEGIVSGRH